MNDRFKFRFWHKPTNKMLDCYGFNEHSTFANTLDGIGTEYNPCATKDCELMQSTGLKDKNGKLIYESDILKDKYGALHPISWNKKGFYEAETFAVAGFYNTIQEDMEVIGNIYENEDLLKCENQ